MIRTRLPSLAAAAAAATLLLAPSARAEDDVDLQQFKPAPGSHDVLAIESARIAAHGGWNGLAVLHYANRPFRLVDRATGEVVATIVGHQTAADVGFSYGWRDRFALGIAIPVMLNQSAGSAGSLDPRIESGIPSRGIGDLRIHPKLVLGSWRHAALALASPVSLPTGDPGLLGHPGVGVRPRVLFELGREGGSTLTANLGVAIRPTARYVNFEQGTALDYGAGAQFPFTIRGARFAAVATLGGEIGLTDDGVEERPLELLAGLRWESPTGASLTLGAGPGLTRGAGTPDYRMFVTFARSTPPRPHHPVLEPRVTVDRKQLKLAVAEPVYFDTDKDTIQSRSFPILEDVAGFLRENPWIRKVRIEGHTDSQGGADYNLDLSRRRADRVEAFLREQGRIEAERLESEGYGLTRPVATNDTSSGRAKNRRVEFVILEIDRKDAPTWAKDAEPGEVLPMTTDAP